MNKIKEKRIFNYVYGDSFADKLTDSEIPDFLIAFSESLILGVEVTEVYENDTDARLKHQTGYMDALLDGHRGVIPADRGNISVDKIKLLGGEEELEVTAVISGVPTLEHAIRKIKQGILSKERKCGSYLEKCDLVDLILHDSSKMFFVDDLQSFYQILFHLIEPETLMSSKFREIYLITSLKNNESFYLPLKGTVFFADLTAIISFISEDNNLSAKENNFQLQLIIFSLYQLGYKGIYLKVAELDFSLFYNSWMVIVSEDQILIRDYSSVSIVPAEFLDAELYLADVSDEQREIVTKLLSRRRHVFSYFPMNFPVRISNDTVA